MVDVGWLVALGAWLLHVGALSLAPLPTMQAVFSGGLVLLAPLFGTADIAIKRLAHVALTHLMLLVNRER